VKEWMNDAWMDGWMIMPFYIHEYGDRRMPGHHREIFFFAGMYRSVWSNLKGNNSLAASQLLFSAFLVVTPDNS